jgi:hypothetical protein
VSLCHAGAVGDRRATAAASSTVATSTHVHCGTGTDTDTDAGTDTDSVARTARGVDDTSMAVINDSATAVGSAVDAAVTVAVGENCGCD